MQKSNRTLPAGISFYNFRCLNNIRCKLNELEHSAAGYGKFGVSLILPLLLLVSCHKIQPIAKPHHPLLRQNSGKEVLALLWEQDDKIWGLKAQAEITLETAGERKWFKAALLVQKPAYLRLELFNQFGQPIQFLVANQERILLYIPITRQAIEASPSGFNLYRLCGIRLELPELVSLLLGQLPWDRKSDNPNSSPAPNLSYLTSEKAYLLEVDYPQRRYKLFLDAWELWLRRLLIEKGSQRMEIAWERFTPLGGTYLPTRLKFAFPQDNTTVEIAYTRPETNFRFDPKLFRLTLPYGVELIHLSSSNGYPRRRPVTSQKVEV